jgi:two-component system aerobic respiration control protein ArcA
MNTRKTSGDKGFAKQVAALNRRALAQSKVVSLEDYRSAAPNTEPQTILIIDDEIVMRNAIKRIFEKDNFKVLAASNALEFSKIIEEVTPNIILIDVGLPWVNGLELCTLLKSHAGLKDIPVAIVSGNKTEEDIRKGYDAGADHYVTKPFEVDDLYRVVVELLEKKTRA